MARGELPMGPLKMRPPLPPRRAPRSEPEPIVCSAAERPFVRWRVMLEAMIESTGARMWVLRRAMAIRGEETAERVREGLTKGALEAARKAAERVK